MRINEIILERKVPDVRTQIINDVRKHGGDINDYFVRFTDTDKLGFSAKQGFGKTPDVDHPKFSVDYIGQGHGRRALWFYPASYYLNNKYGAYATDQPYAWLVKLKPDAWLQVVNKDDAGLEPAPAGKERVGILRMSKPPAAIFFTYGFDVIGRYYDYAGQHKRHGEIKGRPAPSFFDKIRGVTEDVDYLRGHCHVMALALKQLHPDWQIKAHIGWEEEAEDDDDYRIDHVYIVAPDGSAYDCRGRFNNEQELIGPDETGGVETQIVDYSIDDINADVNRGELKRFTKQDIQNALQFIQK